MVSNCGGDLLGEYLSISLPVLCIFCKVSHPFLTFVMANLISIHHVSKTTHAQLGELHSQVSETSYSIPTEHRKLEESVCHKHLYPTWFVIIPITMKPQQRQHQVSCTILQWTLNHREITIS